MKSFKQYLNEAIQRPVSKYENMPVNKLIVQLEKCRTSLIKHTSNPRYMPTLNNSRSQELVDRFEEIRDVLRNTKEGGAALRQWTQKHNYSPDVDGYDFFA